MSKIDPQLNILWLSDIHYHYDYSDKDYHVELKLYLDTFHNYIKNNNKIFDYILISGDIAQNGAAKDYTIFFQDILMKIQNTFPDANLLVIPGNHDVSRDSVNFIEEFIRDSINRDKFLSKNIDAFFGLFNPFSNQFKDNVSISKNSSVSYKKHTLYGYVLDRKSKSIIVMLNSAWYSVGEIFLKYYIENELYKTKEAKKIVKEIKYITNEYGFQTLGLDVLSEIDEIINVLNEYPEYLVITTMHHPINWFVEKDQITNDTFKFHKVKKFTDVLLTGHEHVSMEHPYEYINDSRTLHLKAGCFLDFPYENRDETKSNVLNPFTINDNWFSTLELNTKKRTIKQENHFFNKKNKDWEMLKNKSLLKLTKKHDVVISASRLELIKKSLDKNVLKIIEYLFPKCNINAINNYIYRSSDSIIVFVNTSSILIANDDIKKLYTEGSFDCFYIVFVDLFHELSIEYSNDNNRLLTLNKIKSNFDLNFDNFRHGFFSTLSESETVVYGNVAFLNKILPYWDIEHLNC